MAVVATAWLCVEIVDGRGLVKRDYNTDKQEYLNHVLEGCKKFCQGFAPRIAGDIPSCLSGCDISFKMVTSGMKLGCENKCKALKPKDQISCVYGCTTNFEVK
jgi:hypothetical protein